METPNNPNLIEETNRKLLAIRQKAAKAVEKISSFCD
jgi:hypothetical protein